VHEWEIPYERKVRVGIAHFNLVCGANLLRKIENERQCDNPRRAFSSLEFLILTFNFFQLAQRTLIIELVWKYTKLSLYVESVQYSVNNATQQYVSSRRKCDRKGKTARKTICSLMMRCTRTLNTRRGEKIIFAFSTCSEMWVNRVCTCTSERKRVRMRG